MAAEPGSRPLRRATTERAAAALVPLLAYLDPGEPDKGGGLPTVAIVGIVIGGLLLARSCSC